MSGIDDIFDSMESRDGKRQLSASSNKGDSQQQTRYSSFPGNRLTASDRDESPPLSIMEVTSPIEIFDSSSDSSSPSSPVRTTDYNTNDDQEEAGSALLAQAYNSIQVRTKIRMEKERIRRVSNNLLGWEDDLPVLSAATIQFENIPKLESMTFTEMRAFGEGGLSEYPRAAHGLEVEATAAAKRATPSPMSLPAASFLSANSNLNRTSGRKPEPVPETESERPQPPTSTSTNPTRMDAPMSFSCVETPTTIASEAVTGCDTTTADKKQQQELVAPEAESERPQPPTSNPTRTDAPMSFSCVETPTTTPSEAVTRDTTNTNKEQQQEEQELFAGASSSRESHKRHYSSSDSELESSDVAPAKRSKSRFRRRTCRVRTSSLYLIDQPPEADRSTQRSHSDEDILIMRETREFRNERVLHAQRGLSLSDDVPHLCLGQPPPAFTSAYREPVLLAESPDNHPTSPGERKATDAFYRLPFAFGWKRELVVYSKDSPKYRSGKVFFISPDGRKFSSRKEIAPLLGGELTIDHFCFKRCSQEADPHFELVRPATPSETRSHLDKPRRLPKPSTEGLVWATSTNGESAISTAHSSRISRTPTPFSTPEGKSESELQPEAAPEREPERQPEPVREPEPEPEPEPEASASTHQLDQHEQPRAPSHHNEPINGEQDQQVTRKRVPKPSTEGLVWATSTNGGSPISTRISRTPTKRTPGKSEREPEPEHEHEPEREPEPEPEPKPGHEEEPEPERDQDQDINGNEDRQLQGNVDIIEIDDCDDEVMANASILDIGGEVELAGQQSPPPQQIDRVMDIYVINGRKYIRYDAAPPPIPPPKLVPEQMDMAEYDRHYQRRIREKKLKMALTFSVNEARFGVKVINAIIKTLNMKDRVAVSKVCTTWAMCARDNAAWNRVILRDTEVNNWRLLLTEMARHGTTELDMMGVRMADPKLRFTGDLRVLKTLCVLRTDATTNTFLKMIQGSLPQLKELRSTCISSHLQLSSLEKLQKLRVLRIRMTHPRAQVYALENVAGLKYLTELSMRGVTNMGSLNVMLLKNLTRLEVLSLGFCDKVNSFDFGWRVLPYLKALRTLRIENDHRGTEIFPLLDIMRGVAQAGGVKDLELINVDVDGDFSQLLSECRSVVRLLLTPKCLQNAAKMINAVMEAIRDNADQLRIFRLGLVTQLLRATENLVNGNQKDVIPVQRPVPGMAGNDDLNCCTPDEACTEDDHGQCVAFLPVDRLDAILHSMMPGKGKAVSVAKVAMAETTNLKFLPRDDNNYDDDDTFAYKTEMEKREEDEVYAPIDID